MNAASHVFPKLTFREKLLVSLAAAAVLFTSGYQSVFAPLYERYSTKQIQLKELIDERSVLTSRLKKIDVLQTRLNDENNRSASLKKELATLNGSMTKNDQLKSVLDLLEEMAREANMSLLDISVDLERVASDLPERNRRNHEEASPPVLFYKNLVTLSVESSYKSLARFMQKLSMLPLAMSISKIDISSDPMAHSAGVTARLNLELYSSF